MTSTASHALTKPRSMAKHAFFIALAVAAALFIPFLLLDKGLFIYYGDFNVQQIPFYRMAHDAVRSGNIFWNWNTDLGANFIGSYSFYLLGSPFFWLTLPFPSAAVPYLMGPLLVLKFACSSLAAYAYLQRFVRPKYAVIGGLLYAFSGFSIYNVFFNHFHEAIIYFPLMLLGLEMFMKDNRKGPFGLMVFLSALSNYYFFIGQVFFILIYWFVRMFSDEWECSLSKFFWLLFEAVIGTAAAGVLLLPSFLAVIQNPRTESTLAGWDFLIYTKPQRLFDILHSFFFPQDIPAYPNFFPNSDNKWSSMSAWLPVFGCCGAVAYFQSRKHKDWLRRMLIICFFCAVIPGFNAMFQLFNWAYYARWYYMMILLMVTATMMCFEEAEEHPIEWRHAFGWTFGITAFFALVLGFMPKSWEPDKQTGKVTYGLVDNLAQFWIFVAIAVVSLILAALLVMLFKHDRHLFFRWATAVVACVSLIYSWYLIGMGKARAYYTSDFVIEQGIKGKDKISLPDSDETVRVDMYKGMDNQAMFWQIPTINAFHSIVPGSVMEFYPTIGVERSVGSRPEMSHYALRSFLSTRWLFDYDNSAGKEQKSDNFEANGSTKMPGWKYWDTQNGFRIYENEYYVPMGFTYDQYILRSEYDNLSDSQRERSLLKAIVLEDETAESQRSTLTHFDTAAGVYTESAYFEDCLTRRKNTASSFTRDNGGFSATIQLEKANLVFFSVPYEEGWSATVNGEKAEIIKANVGFMAVACPEGDVEIRFNYMTPGLKYGIIITIGSILLFVLYLLLMRVMDKRMQKRLTIDSAPYMPDGETTAGHAETGYITDGSQMPLGELPMADADKDEINDGDDEFDLYSLYPHAKAQDDGKDNTKNAENTDTPMTPPYPPDDAPDAPPAE